MNNVVIVEDDATMRALLKTLLEIEGYQAFPLDGTSFDDVFDVLKKYAPAVLLMDVHLKGGDSLEILNKIKSDKNLSNVKILMTSGEDLKILCVTHGADGFLLKPYMPDTLLNWLKNNFN